MISISKEANINYLATVVKLEKQVVHPNADKLVGWIINGNRVWTDNSYSIGDIVVYFPLECAINKDILRELNLFREPTLNKDVTKKGYFEAACRVKALKLRGEPSEGIILKATELEDVIEAIENRTIAISLYENFKDALGSSFDTLGNTLVCKKYIPKNTRTPGLPGSRDKRKTKLVDRIIEGQFHRHYPTANLRHHAGIIKPTDVISITKKLHGTSHISSKALVTRELNIFERVLKFFSVKIDDKKYEYVWSSRNVIKGVGDKALASDNSYYTEDIWTIAHNEIKHALIPGLSIYAEIVGFLPGGKAIQSMEKPFDYGCKEGEHKVYVYRITMTNIEGVVHEFSWQAIKDWCTKYDLLYVPQLYFGKAYYLHGEFINMPFISEAMNLTDFPEMTMNLLTNAYLEKDCDMCVNKVPDEGICIRVENKNALKLKSFRFLEGETKELDKEEISIEDEN